MRSKLCERRGKKQPWNSVQAHSSAILKLQSRILREHGSEINACPHKRWQEFLRQLTGTGASGKVEAPGHPHAQELSTAGSCSHWQTERAVGSQQWVQGQQRTGPRCLFLRLTGRRDTEAEAVAQLRDPGPDSSEAKLLSTPADFWAVDTEQGRPRGKWEQQPWGQDSTV